MLLGAMLDAGLPLDALTREVGKVVPHGWRIVPTQVLRGQVRGTHAAVVVEDDRKWDWNQFRNAVSESTLDAGEKLTIQRVFNCLEEAEKEAHGGDASHLHELGTTDTLIDVVGAVAGIRLLRIERLTASPLPTSAGVARSSHGVTASFAPATMSIIRKHRLPVAVGGSASRPTGEAVTPTGAALLATLTDRAHSSQMTIRECGYGAGTRDTADPPNVLGIWIGDAHSSDAREDPDTGHHDETVVLEANIDDSSPEELGYAMERLFDAGALDVWFTPIQMKKNRPGVLMSAMANPDRVSACARAFILHTSTFGVRTRPASRLIASRETIEVEVFDCRVRVKLKLAESSSERTVLDISPEYDDCAALANLVDKPLRQVMQEARRIAWETVNADA